MLAGDPDELTDGQCLQHFERFGDKWTKCLKRTAFRHEDDDTDRSTREVLLELDALINGDEGVELLCSGTEQRAVRQPGPARFYYGYDLVASEFAAESPRDAFIE